MAFQVISTLLFFQGTISKSVSKIVTIAITIIPFKINSKHIAFKITVAFIFQIITSSLFALKITITLFASKITVFNTP